MRVLLAEDDDYLSSGLIMALTRKGYNVERAKTGFEAQSALLAGPYDLMLLDLGLPGLDGTAVLSGLRARGDDLPIIVITARDQVEERINGLDMGANDYLVKPFDVRELEARMRAVLRKSHWKNKLEIEFGSLRLNTNSGQLLFAGKQFDLTKKETIILQTLIARAGRVVSKRQLIDQLSDFVDESSDNAVEVHIHRLRKKLETADVFINTVRGFGYVLEEKP